MKVCFVADVHVGNYGKSGGPVKAGINQRCEDTLRVLGNAVTTATRTYDAPMIVLGDLFDYDRVEPQVVARVQRIFSEERDEDARDVPLFNVFLVGNHDQKSDAHRDHAMAPLAPMGTIVDTEPMWFAYSDYDEDAKHHWTKVLVIPFRAGRAEDWLPEVVAQAMGTSGRREDQVVALAFHLGISDTDTPYFLDGADDSVCLGTVQKLCLAYGFTHVFAGNWHMHQSWLVDSSAPGGMARVIQVGSLCPNRFSDNDNGEKRGCMAVLDTGTGNVKIDEFEGPRFTKVRSLEELEAMTEDHFIGASPAYLSVMVQPDEEDAAETELKALARKYDVRHWEVHIDPTTELAQSRAAVSAAVEAKSQDQAVAAYVAEAPLDDVPRDAVLAFVQDCIREARTQ